MRLRMLKILKRALPKFEVRAGGLTSIDVTRKGIDKGYGIRQIQRHLHVPIQDMLFIGDAIYPGGNDYAVTKTSIDYMKVCGPEETKRLIKKILRA